jgi:putative transposase
VEGPIETRIYQADLLQKEFGQPLNVVIIAQSNRTTQKHGHVILFRSDLALSYDQVIDDSSLRFQIEFTFRDAKHYWGLDDFMNVTATGVTNAATLSLFMVNLADVLLEDIRQQDPQCSVLDLKAQCRGYKSMTELLKLLPELPDEDLIVQLFRRVAQFGRIHPPEPQLTAA